MALPAPTQSGDSLKKILVLGGLASNFRPQHRNDPRIVRWDKDSAGRWKNRNIPSGVIKVLSLRYVNHAERGAVEEQARRQGVPFEQRLLNPGEVQRILEDHLAQNPLPAKHTAPGEGAPDEASSPGPEGPPPAVSPEEVDAGKRRSEEALLHFRGNAELVAVAASEIGDYITLLEGRVAFVDAELAERDDKIKSMEDDLAEATSRVQSQQAMLTDKVNTLQRKDEELARARTEVQSARTHLEQAAKREERDKAELERLYGIEERYNTLLANIQPHLAVAVPQAKRA